MSLTVEERRARHNKANALWRAKNPRYFKDWATKNEEHLKGYQKTYHETVRKANPDKLKRTRKKSRVTYKSKILGILGGKCSNPDCRWLNEDGTIGCTDPRLLEVDHINGDGGRERKEKGYWKIMQSIVAQGHQNKYQLLCKNCNHLKRIKNGEHGKGKPECR